MFQKNDVNYNESKVVSFNNNFKTDDNIEVLALECLKKSNISGKPEEIANEFMKIYNILKIKTNSNLKTNIPEKTVFDDYIICLEDGKHLKMLNRHLKVYYNMTFQEYKQKWGLPIDYPCTCKNHSKKRSDIAKRRKKTQQ